MLAFVPVLAWTGVSASFYVGVLVPLVANSMPSSASVEDKTQVACVAMIFFGVGEICGSSVNGNLIDKLGIKRFIICLIIEIILAHIAILSYSNIMTYNSFFAGVVTFAWGFQDSGGVIVAMCTCGF